MEFEKQLKIIPYMLLPTYCEQVQQGLALQFEALKDADISTDTFSFYTSVSSVFSSKIEGEEIELDSYIKHKRFGVEFLPDYTKKIDDLYHAYEYAQQSKMDRKHIEEAHAILAKHFLSKYQLGENRNQNMFVTTADGRIEYVAATPYELESEMQKFYEDVENLLNATLNFQEVFFFASAIHLTFVKIHPFNDGNGRTGRLLEKWFLSQKLGSKAWFIQVEKYYYQHHQTYYHHLRALGLEYQELDYSKALPFLLMLPQSLLTDVNN